MSRPGPLGKSDAARAKQRFLEFKYIYFKTQRLLNRKVVVSMKYEQLKLPEIRMNFVKPLITEITTFGRCLHLNRVYGHGAVEEGTLYEAEVQLSINIIYVLLLLRYEYMIQLENNLVMYDLLSTKATICEFLAIRLLREYRSSDRIHLLFINPMKHEESELLKNTRHLDNFNTLELCVLSKSKKFLSQPVVVQILDRIYNGEIVINEPSCKDTMGLAAIPNRKVSSEKAFFSSLPLLYDCDSYNDCNIIKYKFSRVTIAKVVLRSHIVPKYQLLVVNLKYMFLTALFLVLVLQHKHRKANGQPAGLWGMAFSGMFWTIALSFNFDMLTRLLHIEWKFLKKIVWIHIDLAIVFLIDVSFALRVLMGLNKILVDLYYKCFSLISILLFPRMLSVFNGYEFFNMIILSLRRMVVHMVAMFFLFALLTFGFFLCFISLTIDLSTYDIAFSMLKLFFGFTPAVWNNWDSYLNLGRGVQLAYLFLSQFIVSTILAIVLSNVFSKVHQTNKEEFEYMRTTNLIIYLKWGALQTLARTRLMALFTEIVNLYKLPIIFTIYVYEIVVGDSRKALHFQQTSLKNFSFLGDDDFYDRDLVLTMQQLGEDTESLARRLVRKVLIVGPRRMRPQQSQYTLGGFSGLVELVRFDDEERRRQKKSVLAKLEELERMVRGLSDESDSD